MKAKIAAVIFMTVLIAVSGCKKRSSTEIPVVTPQDPLIPAEIRIHNATNWVFHDCIVEFPKPATTSTGTFGFNYGQVNVDAKSEYKTFSRAYRYAALQLTMNGKEYRITPYDYVRETPLDTGKYTYKITYLATGDRLNLECTKD